MEVEKGGFGVELVDSDDLVVRCGGGSRRLTSPYHVINPNTPHVFSIARKSSVLYVAADAGVQDGSDSITQPEA